MTVSMKIGGGEALEEDEDAPIIADRYMDSPVYSSSIRPNG
jgi:hypothetical protein